jgi:hypothetical protein
VPLVCSGAPWERFEALSGVALPVRVAADGARRAPAFEEDLLFTHRGLSGPAALQISTFWRPGESVSVDLLPGVDPAAALREAKAVSGRRLGPCWPSCCRAGWPRPGYSRRPAWPSAGSPTSATPTWRAWPNRCGAGRSGRRVPRATARPRSPPAGVDTRELESRSGESRRVRGLHFIGEVVDVTGWLGGYNFQWAWASAGPAPRRSPRPEPALVPGGP